MKTVTFILVVFFQSLLHAVEDERLKVHFISGSLEYKSTDSLKKFKEHLEKHHAVSVTASWVEDKAKDLPGVEFIKEADVIVVFARRLNLPEDQMSAVRSHWEAEKGVVGIRTASHAFSNEDNKIFDLKILGGNYDGHFGDEPVKVAFTEVGKNHNLLKIFASGPSSKLYKAGKLGKATIVLQTGSITRKDGGTVSHPVTWTNTFGKNGRAFYTSLGVPGDFEDEGFLKMLAGAVLWTSHRKASK